jgi:hypothetical protein
MSFILTFKLSNIITVKNNKRHPVKPIKGLIASGKNLPYIITDTLIPCAMRLFTINGNIIKNGKIYILLIITSPNTNANMLIIQIKLTNVNNPKNDGII